MDHLARTYYESREFFVVVDDIGSIKDPLPAIDHVHSKDILSNFGSRARHTEAASAAM